MTTFKQKVSRAFGQAAPFYDAHAGLQESIAGRLIASLEPWKGIIPSGPIVELGCGTGFLTEKLVDLYPDRVIEATDLSEGMVQYARQKLKGPDPLSFSVLDAEDPPYEEPHYALTVGNFVSHWFKNPAQTLGKWLTATKPGGLLLVSFPGNESFPAWKKHCRELGLPFTANALPDVEEMVVKMSVGPSQVDFYEDTVTQTFDSPRHFFRHLKQTGSSVQRQGRTLSAKEMRLLLDHWEQAAGESITVTYHVVFLVVKRDYDS